MATAKLFLPAFFGLQTAGDNRTALASGKVYTYVVGTTTNKTAYDGPNTTTATPLSNPVVLDSNGEATIYLDGVYRLLVTDSNDVTIFDITSDSFIVDGYSSLSLSGTLSIANGTVSTPSLTFSSDTNTGLYRVGTDQLGLTTNGSLAGTFNTTGFRSIDGSATNPSLQVSDVGGFYKVSTDVLGIATGGTQIAQYASTGLQLIGASTSLLIDGATVLSKTSLGSGVVSSSLTSVGSLTSLTVSGATTLSSTVGITGVLSIANGSASTPSLAFSSDADTGLYNVSGNILGVTTGGTQIAQYASTGLQLIGASSSYFIDGTTVLSKTSLGSGVVSSSLTSLGSLTSLTVSGATTLSSTLGVTGNVSVNSTAFGVNSSGYVGVGTGISTASLTIPLSVWGTAATFNANAGTDPSTNYVLLNKDDTINTGPAMSFATYYNGPFTCVNGQIEVQRESGPSGAGSTGNGTMLFKLTSSLSLATKLSIDSSGLIEPGTDGTQDIGSSSLRFQDIYATNATIQTSDATMKKDVEDLNLGVEFVKALRPVKYRWKDLPARYETVKDTDGQDTIQKVQDGVIHRRKHLGLLAQELESTLEQFNISSDDFAALIKSKDGKMGIRYNELVPILIKSVQELSSEIDKLKGV